MIFLTVATLVGVANAAQQSNHGWEATRQRLQDGNTLKPSVTSQINGGMPGKTLPSRLQNGEPSSPDDEAELVRKVLKYFEDNCLDECSQSIKLIKNLYEKAKSVQSFYEKGIEKVKSWGLRRRLQGKSSRRRLFSLTELFSSIFGGGLEKTVTAAGNANYWQHSNRTNRRQQDNSMEMQMYGMCMAKTDCRYCKATGRDNGKVCPVCKGSGNAKNSEQIANGCRESLNRLNQANNTSWFVQPPGPPAKRRLADVTQSHRTKHNTMTGNVNYVDVGTGHIAQTA